MAVYPPKRILVPTDLSPASTAAFDYALRVAAAASAHVRIIHVMEQSVYSLDFAMTHPGYAPEVKRRTGELLDAWVAQARRRGVTAESVIVSGIPFHEICTEATRQKADLVVMGTHGRTGLAHVVLGSTAERVIRAAPCPVLTIKGGPKPVISVPVLYGEQAPKRRGATASPGRRTARTTTRGRSHALSGRALHEARR